MPTEILSGLWIGDINDSFNKEFINDNLITIFINCTLNYGFIDIPNTKKLRIPLSSNLDPQKDLILLKYSSRIIFQSFQGNFARQIPKFFLNFSKYPYFTH